MAVNDFQEKSKELRAGVDLGGTNIKVGLVNWENRILASASIPTLAEREPKEIVKDMADTVRKLLAEINKGMEDCAGVGIGSPGTIDRNQGVVLYSNNIRWENVPLAQLLSEELGVMVRIDNDANCATLGEVKAGAARGCNNVTLLTLGTGIGSGIIYQGRLLGSGGELGHILLEQGGRKCTCGRRGCAEAYASATALIKDTKGVAAAHPASLLYKLCDGRLERMNAEIPFQAAKQGDREAQKLIDRYIQALGELVTDIANFYQPEKVLLGGGVSVQGEYLTRPIEEYVNRNRFGWSHIPKVRVEVAQLGNQAGIIGAAGLIEVD